MINGVRRIIEQGIERVRHILEVRQPALEALTERLIEVESVDSVELKTIIDENSPGPLVMPATSDTPFRLSKESPAENDSPGKAEVGG